MSGRTKRKLKYWISEAILLKMNGFEKEQKYTGARSKLNLVSGGNKNE